MSVHRWVIAIAVAGRISQWANKVASGGGVPEKRLKEIECGRERPKYHSCQAYVLFEYFMERMCEKHGSTPAWNGSPSFNNVEKKVFTEGPPLEIALNSKNHRCS